MSVDPEELDIAILREMYRTGAVNLAGIDPRLNATRIARALGVGRARIAGRLRFWREIGFLRKYAVWLNPALLGWQGAWLAIRVDHHRSKPELFRRLALVDGVVSGMDFLGEWISVAIVAPDTNSLGRRVGLIRHFSEVKEIEGPVLWQIPPPHRPLTSLEIRIVRALRAQPSATLSEIAKRVGVSTRTITRKYSALVDDWAVWFVPIFDFTVLARPIVSLNVHARPGVEKEGISRALHARFPLTLEFTSAVVGPEASPEDFVFFVTLPSAASIEELEQLAASLDGVERIESYVMVRIHDFPDWFDSHLETLGNPVSRETRGKPSPPAGPGARHPGAAREGARGPSS